MASSDKRKTSNSRRISSITGKLQRRMFFIRFLTFLVIDLILMAILTVGYAAVVEKERTGDFDISRSRDFQEENGKNYYIVYDDDDNELLRIAVAPVRRNVFIICGSLLLVQMFFMLLFLFDDYRVIRKTLKPLNEIALQADQLSKLNYVDEERMAMIEDAIDHIQPGDEAPLSIPDNDLAGIEAAMNNLILRMKDNYRQQTRFVNDASHELRTPIAVIQGYADMLDRWGRDDPEVLEESIQAIKHETTHMNRLVEQLLFLARGDSGRTELKPEPVSLGNMMQEIYEESLMIDEAHVYRFKKPETDITIRADETLMKQAVRILIDNAAKYTEKDCDIVLSAGRTGDGCPYLQVQDTGMGMAEADVKHMFERFYRSDETREIKGTGLGLSIAKWIIDKHRGHFEVLSRTELGTRIRILLPQEAVLAAAPATDSKDADEETDTETVMEPDTETAMDTDAETESDDMRTGTM